MGGKRPDFIADPKDNGSWLLIDAKYHSTANCTTFKLKDSEIVKYRGLVQFCVEKFPEASLDMVFMVFPKECDGNKVVWVNLDEFDKGEPTTLLSEPATYVSLEDRDELWCTNA
jgi:hypothetical protein